MRVAPLRTFQDSQPTALIEQLICYTLYTPHYESPTFSFQFFPVEKTGSFSFNCSILEKPLPWYSVGRKLFAYVHKPNDFIVCSDCILGGSIIYTLARLPSSHEFQHLIRPVTISITLSLYHLSCGCGD